MSKTISIRDDVVEKLIMRKQKGQSYSGVIEGLLDDVAFLQEQLRYCVKKVEE